MSDTKTLTCNHCGGVKPLTEFCAEKRVALGVAPLCKECRRKKRQANGAYLRERIRKYKIRSNRNVTILLTVDDLKQILQKETCTYCGREPEEKCIDHIFSLNSGYGGAYAFTDELWRAFVADFGKRYMFKRDLSEEEIDWLSTGFAQEAADLATGGEANEKAE